MPVAPEFTIGTAFTSLNETGDLNTGSISISAIDLDSGFDLSLVRIGDPGTFVSSERLLTDAEIDLLTASSSLTSNGTPTAATTVSFSAAFTADVHFLKEGESVVVTFRVIADDGDFQPHVDLTVTYHGVADAPTDISLDDTTIDENAAADTVVGKLTTTDADVGDTFTYKILADDGTFKIGGTNLDQLLVADPSKLDYETATGNKVTVKIQVTDGAGKTTDKAIDITLSDAADAPTAIGLDKASSTSSRRRTRWLARSPPPTRIRARPSLTRSSKSKARFTSTATSSRFSTGCSSTSSRASLRT
jgi:VCBS repeat-containing protein